MISDVLLRIKLKARTICYLQNWLEVWKLNRSKKFIPELRFRSGLRLRQGEGDILWDLFVEVFLERCYDHHSLEPLTARSVILDAGANIGSFAHYVQWQALGAKVHCFEPAERTRAQLQKNIELNSFQNSISVYPFGLLDRKTDVVLKGGDVSGNRSLFEREEAGRVRANTVDETIHCISLSEALAKTGCAEIDLFKLDVEGAEIEVLNGATRDDFKKIKAVAIEYHDNLRPQCSEVVLRRLKELGMSQVYQVKQSDLAGIIFAKH